MKKYFCAFFMIIVCSYCSLSSADTLYLNNGKVIFGDVKEKGSYYVVFVENGVEHKYYDSEIQRIDEDGQVTVKSSPKPKGNTVINQRKTAPNAKEELIRHFLDVNGTTENLERTLRAMLIKVPQVQRAAYEKIFSIDRIFNKLIPIYDSYFTESDLQDMVDFYESPAGKKLIENTPQITQSMIQALSDLIKNVPAP